jgi:hypothetical protein
MTMRPTIPRTKRAKVSTRPKPTIALANKALPYSGEYDSAISKEPKIIPTANAQPVNGIPAIPIATDFIDLMKSKTPRTYSQSLH